MLRDACRSLRSGLDVRRGEAAVLYRDRRPPVNALLPSCYSCVEARVTEMMDRFASGRPSCTVSTEAVGEHALVAVEKTDLSMFATTAAETLR